MISSAHKGRFPNTSFDQQKQENKDRSIWCIVLSRFKVRKWQAFAATLILGVVTLGVLNIHLQRRDTVAVRSDLVIPVEMAFLHRPELIAQLDKAFKGNEKIQTIALVGIGGSGKTTTARQYAHQQKANVIWEINSETNSSLIGSFENLAHTLSITEDDKRILHELTGD